MKSIDALKPPPVIDDLPAEDISVDRLAAIIFGRTTLFVLSQFLIVAIWNTAVLLMVRTETASSPDAKVFSLILIVAIEVSYAVALFLNGRKRCNRTMAKPNPHHGKLTDTRIEILMAATGIFIFLASLAVHGEVRHPLLPFLGLTIPISLLFWLVFVVVRIVLSKKIRLAAIAILLMLSVSYCLVWWI